MTMTSAAYADSLNKSCFKQKLAGIRTASIQLLVERALNLLQGRHFKVVCLLLASPGSKQAVTVQYKGATPLAVALAMGCHDIARVLLNLLKYACISSSHSESA